MSARRLIELIRHELPQNVLDDLESKSSDIEFYDDLSVRDFSMGPILRPKELKSILENKLRIIEGQKMNPSVQKFNQQRLNFVNEAMAGANIPELWSGYCMVKVRYLIFLKKRKTLWFDIDLTRKKFLKHFHPITPFGREVFWK